MKKNMILMVAMFIFATVAYGQNAPSKASTPEERAAKMTEKMKKDLTLTADQEQKVKQINLDAAKRNEDIKKQATANKTDNKTALQQSETQRDADLQKVLTPDQFKKYQQMKAEKKDEMKAKKEEMKK